MFKWGLRLPNSLSLDFKAPLPGILFPLSWWLCYAPVLVALVITVVL